MGEKTTRVKVKDIRGTFYTWEHHGGHVRMIGPQMLVPGVQQRRYVLEISDEEWFRLVRELGVPAAVQPEAVDRTPAEVCAVGGHRMRVVPLPSSISLKKCERCGYEEWVDLMGAIMDDETGEVTHESGTFTPTPQHDSMWHIRREGDWWTYADWA